MMQFDFAPVRAVLVWRSSGLGEFFSLGWGGGIFSAWLPFFPWRGEVNQSCGRDHAEPSSHTVA